MCVNAFFPKPPDPQTPAPATPPPPTIAPVKPKIRPLLDPKKIAKVDYGSKVKRNEGQKQVTADSLKINVGGGAPPAADTGGLNVT